MGLRELVLSAALATSSAPAETNVEQVRENLKELRVTVAGNTLKVVEGLAPYFNDGKLSDTEKASIK